MKELTPVQLVIEAAERLGDLRSEVVFLGGAVVGLLISERGGRPPRATKDVDVVMEIVARIDYYRVDARLREKGFVNDPSGPVCRYMHGSIMIDVLPTGPDVFGFANRFYPLAVTSAVRSRLTPSIEINLITAPCFVATKMEAFDDPGREGHGDIFLSRDFEDVIRVIDGRPSVAEEILVAPAELRRYLGQRFSRMLDEYYLEEAIAEFVDPGREEIVIQRMKAFARPS